jgi:predicted transcriptional regulator
MENAKRQVEEILTSLPDDSSLEDIQYHIFVRQRIEQGLADADAGRVLTHAEVQQRLAKWLAK